MCRSYHPSLDGLVANGWNDTTFRLQTQRLSQNFLFAVRTFHPSPPFLPRQPCNNPSCPAAPFRRFDSGPRRQYSRPPVSVQQTSRSVQQTSSFSTGTLPLQYRYPPASVQVPSRFSTGTLPLQYRYPPASVQVPSASCVHGVSPMDLKPLRAKMTHLLRLLATGGPPRTRRNRQSRLPPTARSRGRCRR